MFGEQRAEYERLEARLKKLARPVTFFSDLKAKFQGDKTVDVGAAERAWDAEHPEAAREYWAIVRRQKELEGPFRPHVSGCTCMDCR